MGLFGSKHGSADSTTTSKTWGADTIESILTSGVKPNWYYEDETLAPINSQMQQILDYELSPTGINNAKNMMGKGKQILGIGIDRARELGGITGQDVLDKWKSMTMNGYNDASDFMATQDAAIENHVMAVMGGDLAQNTQSNMATSGAFTSGQVNSSNAIVAQSANNMETQESAMAMKIARAAATGSAGAINSALRVKAGEAGLITKAGLGVIGTGAGMLDKAANNMWQAGTFETAYNQKQNNVNRHNDMINNNLPMIEDLEWYKAFVQAQGIDTTSSTHTSY